MAQGAHRLLRSSLLTLGILTSIPAIADYFSDARQYSENGENQAAIIQLKNLLQESPGHLQGRTLLGRLLLKEQQPGAAEKEIGKALQLGADPQQLIPLLVRSQIRQRKLKVALETLSTRWDENTSSGERWLLLGNIRLGLRQLDEAEQAYYQALQIAEDSRALLGLSLIARSHGQPEQALSTLENILDDPATATEARLLKAEILLDLQRPAQALTIIDGMLEQRSELLSLNLLKARGLLLQRNYPGTRQQLAALPPRYHELPQYLLLSAMTAMGEQNYRQALADAQAAEQRNPNNPRGLLIAGTALYMSRDFEQAESYLQRYSRKVPADLNALRLLAASQQNLKRPEDALQTLAPALQLAAPDAGVLAIAGYSWLALGEWEKGEALLSRALAINPQLSDLRNRLLFSQIMSGNSERALATIDIGDDSSQSSDTQQDSLRVIAWLQQKQFEPALAFLLRRQQQFPRQAAYPILQALVELRRQNNAGARRAFQQALALQTENPAALIGLARIELMEKKPGAAREYFMRIVRSNENHLGALMGLARVDAELSGDAEMLKWLRLAKQRQPQAIQPVIALTNYYRRQNEVDKARNEARAFQLSNPDSAEAKVLYITTLRATGNIAEAHKLATRLQHKHPRKAAYKRLLAELLRDQQKFPEALKVARQALDLQPDQPGGLLLYSDLLNRNGQHSRALTQAQKLRENFPGATSSRLLGQTYLYLKRGDEAVAMLEEASAAGLDAVLALNLSAAYQLLGQQQPAVDILLRYLEQQPDNPGVRFKLAGLYQVSQQYPQAAEQYQQLTRQQPENPIAWNNLAWVLQQQHDRKSVEYAMEALRLAPERADIKDTLGWILVEFGDIDDAIRLLNEAAAALPDNAEVRLHLAQALIRSGQPDKARRQLQTLIDAENNFSDSARALLRQLDQ